MRLYYNDPFLYSFDAAVAEVAPLDGGRTGVVLDRTAFYPTSGGQPFDTGILRVDSHEFRVVDVRDREADDAIVHVIETSHAQALQPGERVHGEIDVARRRDHMQQHSGQHVLSAAFVRLFQMPTVSFHLGEESCTIDVTASSLNSQQVERAEALANDVVTEDRPVEIRYATLEEAQQMGLRKLPPRSGTIRLIDIHHFDLTACGGTHVRSTGQIGPILLRKIEKVRQGMRVEFLCGARAVRASRREYETLTQAAEVFSTHIHELPAQARKSADELKSAGKAQQRLLEHLAEYEARDLVANAPEIGGFNLVERVYGDRDGAYAKLIAQKAVASARAVALIATSAGEPRIVLAASQGIEINCGALLKEALAEVGARGGGSRELAQGGVADRSKLDVVMNAIRGKLRG